MAVLESFVSFYVRFKHVLRGQRGLYLVSGEGLCPAGTVIGSMRGVS